MDPGQQEKDEQFSQTNWTSDPVRVPPTAQYPNTLPSPVYETRAATDDIQTDADRRWAEYLQSYSPTNAPSFQPHFDGNRHLQTYAGPSNYYHGPPLLSSLSHREQLPTLSQPPMLHITHPPAHSDQIYLPGANQMPPDIPGPSATTENANVHALWDQTCANAAQWIAEGIIEPKDQTGQSVLMQWVERRSNTFYCKVPTSTGYCSFDNIKKSRVVSHIRKDHLNFRPYYCRGGCGNQHCKSQFPSNSALADHKLSPIACENCGKTMRRQNYKDHLQKACTSRFS